MISIFVLLVDIRPGNKPYLSDISGLFRFLIAPV